MPPPARRVAIAGAGCSGGMRCADAKSTAHHLSISKVRFATDLYGVESANGVVVFRGNNMTDTTVAQTHGDNKGGSLVWQTISDTIDRAVNLRIVTLVGEASITG